MTKSGVDGSDIVSSDSSARLRIIEAALDAAEIQEASINDDTLTIDLTDGRTASIPIVYFPRLWHGLPEERAVFENHGEYLTWPMLDEDIAVRTILLGPSGRESEQSFARWRRWIDARRAGKTDAEFASEFED
jgi:hypothetical protein